jgi:hypothetical protein
LTGLDVTIRHFFEEGDSMVDSTKFSAMLVELTSAIDARDARDKERETAMAEKMAKLEEANTETLSLQLALDDATSTLKSLIERLNAPKV